MAENTFKKPNTPRNKPKATKEQKQKGQQEETSAKYSFEFLKDRRLHLALGFFVMVFAIFLTISFLSYFFTGSEDQSLVEGLWDTHIRDAGKEVQNWLGISGAFLSYWFMFRWFGIASFLFIPIIFYGGYKVVFGKAIFNFWSVLRPSLFFLFWVSITLGYVVLQLDKLTNLTFICGGIGFELADLSNSLVGWGTPLLLGFTFITFSIYFFNITSFGNTETAAPNKDDQDMADATLEAVNEEADVQVAEPEDDGSEWVVKGPEVEAELDEEEVEEEVEEEEVEEEEVEEVEEEVEEEEEEIEEVEIPVVNTPLVSIVKDTLKSGGDEIGVTIQQGQGEQIIAAGSIENYDPTLDLSSYKYPTIDLLNEYKAGPATVSEDELKLNIDRIVDTLKNYDISIDSIKATIGPSITLYEIVPSAGIRISKIKNLEDDIALSLAALGIRIIAPIPGKGTIGIEVPNKNKEMVSLRSVLATEKFMKSDMDLPVVFGKTISNEIFLKDLAKMPHLLIAGATGQGKSVGLNVLLASLLYKKHPSQLKFVLVDPKKVELSVFRTIERHFLAMLPGTAEAIITDTKKVIHTLNSLCMEMDNRYELLKNAGCRNLKEYNDKFVQRKLNPNQGHRFMPYIVLVIDELADLMMTAGKEVETPIARLAQLARAIGIHLVVATQRPSVNVITGIIKANFPARLSFKVTAKVDSRTILDQGGADQLVGQGDMLFSNGAELERVQCAFVDTPEIVGLCEYIGNQRGYESAYLLPEYQEDEDGGGKEEFDPNELDTLFEEAARLVVAHQQGSTSLIQRRLKLGYNRAGRIIDQLEQAGIVGQFTGSKAREVNVKDEMSLNEILKGIKGGA